MGAGEATITALTHKGAVRDENEDAIILGPIVASASMTSPAHCTIPTGSPTVVAVADGIGGQAAGEIASEHVARRMAEVGPQLKTPEDVQGLLRVLDSEVQDHAAQHPEFSGMGTTVAGILLLADGVLWFNVGDSRTYRLEGRSLRQLSEDDSPAVPPSEGGRPAATNFITQSLGGSSGGSMVPHVGRDEGSAPGVWLMCTDGLTDLVTVDEMTQLITRAGSDEAAVHALWQAAMEAGGKDNISIVLARV